MISEVKPKCLIVDDDYLISMQFASLASSWGFEVVMARSAAEAVEAATTVNPEIILMDVRLVGDRDGVDASYEICGKMDTRIIFITGSQEPETIDKINTDSPYAIFSKPVNPEKLREAMTN